MADAIKPDLCVIGASAGGIAAAAAAVAVGASVVLVDQGRWLADLDLALASLIAASATPLERQGGFPGLIQRIGRIVDAAAPETAPARLRAMGCRIVHGRARFRDGRALETEDGTVIAARRFIVAVPGRQVRPAIEGLADVPFADEETVLGLPRLPERLVVLGGGRRGVELAQTFRRLGSGVTVVAPAALLPRFDPELVGPVRQAMRRSGIVVHEHATVVRVARKQDGLTCGFHGIDGTASSEDGSHILVTGGWQADVDGLAIENAGLTITDGTIETDGLSRTRNHRIYALGIAGRGGRERAGGGQVPGAVVANALLNAGTRIDGAAPLYVQSTPPIASTGIDEPQARQRHGRLEVLRAPFDRLPLARAEEDRTGFAKVVADARGRIIGAGIVGARAGELIAPFALAVSQELAITDLARLAVAEPTRSEIMRGLSEAYFAARLGSGRVRFALRFSRWFG